MTSTWNYSFEAMPGDRLTADLAKELSEVFSSSYGVWSDSAPAPLRPGARIRMSVAKYMADYANSNYKIIVCRNGQSTVGHAVFMEKQTTKGRVALVVQLVVSEEHRHRGIAKAMMHCIWGFSDYYAWAVVTSSPCTVEAIESATFRRVKPSRIMQDTELFKSEILPEVPFLSTAEWIADGTKSIVNTMFWTSRSNIQEGRTDVKGRIGTLPEGYEWLAIVFRDQELDDFNSYLTLIECSGRFVFEAYARMPQAKQNWAQYAATEVEQILKWLPDIDRNDHVCDFGSGSARHVKALLGLGFHNVKGVDLALTDEARAFGVAHGDCRDWVSDVKFRLITCLFDVIGSFPKDEDNKRILRNISRNLVVGGYAVISVANSDFGGKKGVSAVDAEDRREFVKSVFRLQPANAMSTDGEFFCHESLWDKKTGLFYHKEQFRDPIAALPAEYLVVDRRFTASEIEKWVEDAGLKVVLRRFVRAGFAADCTEETGKEILIIARK